MALKRDLKAIFILDLYNILLQIATRTVKREQKLSEQSMNGSSGSKNYWELNDPESRVVDRGHTITVLEVF